MSRATAVAAVANEDLRDVLLIDTYDGAPANMAEFRPLNPFHVWPEPVLAVPGTTETSTSVEAIWQGLKLIDGATDFRQFHSRPCKRPTDAERRASPTFRYSEARFRYADAEIDLLSARFLIYAIAFLELLDRAVAPPLIERIRGAARDGAQVVFYDWDDNPDISDTRTSFAHSALLRAWFAGDLGTFLIEPARHCLTPPLFERFSREVAERTQRYREGKSDRGDRGRHAENRGAPRF